MDLAGRIWVRACEGVRPGASGSPSSPTLRASAMQSVPDRVEILVRDNRPEDYAALCTLLGALFEEYRSQIDSRVFLAYLGDLVDGEMQRPARVLVAESGGEGGGTVTYRPREGGQATPPAGLATLRALAVDGRWRRRGVGRLLIQRCIELAR